MLNDAGKKQKEQMFAGLTTDKMNTGSFEARQKLKLRAD